MTNPEDELTALIVAHVDDGSWWYQVAYGDEKLARLLARHLIRNGWGVPPYATGKNHPSLALPGGSVTNPFLTTPPAPEVPDALREWQRSYGPGRTFVESGNRLAAELDRTRAMVVSLEQEAHALRGLVERALKLRELDDQYEPQPFREWEADADRVLALGDDGDEGE